jgi:hypothetical protein
MQTRILKRLEDAPESVKKTLLFQRRICKEVKKAQRHRLGPSLVPAVFLKTTLKIANRDNIASWRRDEISMRITRKTYSSFL